MSVDLIAWCTFLCGSSEIHLHNMGPTRFSDCGGNKLVHANDLGIVVLDTAKRRWLWVDPNSHAKNFSKRLQKNPGIRKPGEWRIANYG